jgi:hypothetical protein
MGCVWLMRERGWNLLYILLYSEFRHSRQNLTQNGGHLEPCEHSEGPVQAADTCILIADFL